MELFVIVKKELTLSQQHQTSEKYNKIDRVRAILSMNRALWGEVSPALRAAKIKWDDITIHLFFYYDGEISEDDYESAQDVATEVISDFPKHELEVNILRWDYPKPIPQESLETVYRRREKKPT
jgi:hypothetical protein